MKLALVTGGNTGIGNAVVHEFMDNGYTVIVNYLEEPHHASKMSKIHGKQVILVKGDITKQTTQKALLKAVKKFGRLDVLVNNAAILLRIDIMKSNESDWIKTMNINAVAPLILARTMLPYLKKAKGSIVNVSSIRAHQPNPNKVAYCASKAALSNLTKAMAKSFAPVRVNTVSPGPIKTRMMYGQTGREKEMLLKRLGKPKEIAHIIRAVAENTFMTGSDVVVDGGCMLK